MKIWYDTEFIENGRTIKLLSIGMVREDGKEYYAVSADVDYAEADPWVRENVLPHLEGYKAKPLPIIRDEVKAFVLEQPTKPELWAYYGAYDHVALCQLFGKMVDLPKGFPYFTRDVKQFCVDVGAPRLPKQMSVEHHALCDARWTRQAWEFCEQHRLERILQIQLDERKRCADVVLHSRSLHASSHDARFRKVVADAILKQP
jgi:hypothetical protein